MKNGFTLIELIVAILIFAIITALSYQTISSLVKTKETVIRAQDKWGDIGGAINTINRTCMRSIPLPIRDVDGKLLPAIYGKDKLTSQFDSQIELTINGYIGDNVFGFEAPSRIGFRYADNKLYLVNWPVLNRSSLTQPQLELLIDDIDAFKVTFLYPNGTWKTTWPPTDSSDSDVNSIAIMPPAIEFYFKLKTGEEITRRPAI